MNNTDLIHLIKHFMHNELKAVEEVIDSHFLNSLI